MRIGIPKGFYYYTYRPFIETFFREMGLDVSFGSDTNQQIMQQGIASCVDEACFPVKLFHGHVKSLSEQCDKLVIPRIMRTEYGESVCPKIEGLPDMAAEQTASEQMIFSEPLYLDDQKALEKTLWKGCKSLGVKKSVFKRSFQQALGVQRTVVRGYDDQGYGFKVFLAGHPYHIYDSFANLNLIQKLHHMDIGVITEERVPRQEKEQQISYTDLMKQPYWTFFINLFGSAKALEDRGIDGMIYLSSFSCGTDSFTIEMLKNNLNQLPLLILKLDEQRGEAGFETRLEAFSDVLKRRKKG